MTWQQHKANVAHFFMRPFLMFCQTFFFFVHNLFNISYGFCLYFFVCAIVAWFFFRQSFVFLLSSIGFTCSMWPNCTEISMDHILPIMSVYFSISISISHPLLIIIIIIIIKQYFLSNEKEWDEKMQRMGIVLLTLV